MSEMVEPELLDASEHARSAPNGIVCAREVQRADRVFMPSSERIAAVLRLARDAALPVDVRWRWARTLVDEFDVAFAQETRRDAVRELFADYDRVVHEVFVPEFAAHGRRRFARWSELGASQRGALRRYFRHSVLPLLTPTAVDGSHPFPRVPTLAVNLAVLIGRGNQSADGLACLSVPRRLPRLLAISTGTVLLIEDLISASLSDLFVGVDLIDSFCFRVTHGTEQASVARLEVERESADQYATRLAHHLGVTDVAISLVSSTISMGQVWRFDDVALGATVRAQAGRLAQQRAQLDPSCLPVRPTPAPRHNNA